MGNLTVYNTPASDTPSESSNPNSAEARYFQARSQGNTFMGKQSFSSDPKEPMGSYNVTQDAPSQFGPDDIVQVGNVTMTAKQANEQGLLAVKDIGGQAVYYEASKEPSTDKEGDSPQEQGQEEVTPTPEVAEALADPETEAKIEEIADRVGGENLTSVATQALQGADSDQTMTRLGNELGLAENDPEATRDAFSEIYEGLAPTAYQYIDKHSGLEGISGEDVVAWAEKNLNEGEKFDAYIGVFSGNMKALDKVVDQFKMKNPHLT